MFGRKLRKLFLFLLRHSKVNLRTSTYIFYKSTAPANINFAAFGTFFLRSAARKFAYSAVCGNTYAPLPPPLHAWHSMWNAKGIHFWTLTILALYKWFTSSIKIFRHYNICWWKKLIFFAERYPPLAF